MYIEIFGMPIGYGCDALGADLSYDEINKYISECFTNHKVVRNTKINKAEVFPSDMYKDDAKIKYITPVISMNKNLYNNVTECLNNNNFPIIIGGDHTTAIGSIGSVLDYYNGDVSVIWIDAHTDIHNELTTLSGNIHGMPLSILIGNNSERFNISKYKLHPDNIYYIGINSYEDEEMHYVTSNNITYYTDEYVNEVGIEKIINEIKSKIKTKYVHISFDFDVIKTEEFSSVNVTYNNIYPNNGGISLNTAKNILISCINNMNVSSIDLVEYNPLLDNDSEDIKKIIDVIKLIDITLG